MPSAGTEAPPVSISGSTAQRRIRLRSLIAGAGTKLERAGQWLDARTGLLVLTLLLTYLLITVPVSCRRPLWHDELFTYNIALLPSLSQMLRAIRTIDLNPPLLYLLDAITLRIPGAHASYAMANLMARLPSLTGGLLASLGLFLWLRPRIGPVWSLVAVSVLWNTELIDYTWEDRPYALVVGLTILLILAWQRAAKPGRRPCWIAANLTLALSVMASHFIGAFILLAFLAAETVRGWKQRRADLPLLTCYILPLALVVVYQQTISGYGEAVFPEAYRVHLITPLVEYAALAGYRLCPVLLVGLLVLLLPGSSRPGRPRLLSTRDSHGFASIPEWVLLTGLFLEPAIAAAMAAESHSAFYPRYGLPACIAIAVLAVLMLGVVFDFSKGVAVLAILALWWAPLHASTRLLLKPENRPPTEASRRPGKDIRTVEPGLPLVAASGVTFVEMNHYEGPAFLDRTYYLTDTGAAVEYAHATLFEGESTVAQIFHFQAHVERLSSFTASHPKFLVLARWKDPEQWLLRKLQADGDGIRYLGNFSDLYTDHELYEVTVRTRSK